jgi:unsaturated rhamnogalacturonyl hydrolase
VRRSWIGLAAVVALPLATVRPEAAAEPRLRLTARNPLPAARPSETLELSAAALSSSFRAEDLARVHVREEPSGCEVLSQAVDLTGDGVPEQLVFQVDFAPRETRVFSLTPGERRKPVRDDFRVYGRFVRERFDDFAWENDRIAHRMYGAALETWEKEPLTSSTVDVWCKRTRRLVINDWYMVDDYHVDHGEGADFYSAGRSRGCGGSGLWSGGRLYTSRNFRQSRVLASGPIRLVFELVYEAWDVAGTQVAETKRITLDAGWNMDRFESFYRATGDAAPTWAAGIKKAAGSQVRVERGEGWLRTWEPVVDKQGWLGCGLIVDPASLVDVVEADGNALVVSRSAAGTPVRYYAGFGWDRSGDFAGLADWDAYLRAVARRLRAPIEIDIKPE